MSTPDFIGMYPKLASEDFCSRMIGMFESSEELGFTTSRGEQGYNKSTADDSAIFHNSFSMNHAQKGIYQEFNALLWDAYHKYADQYSIALTENSGQHHVYEAKIQKTKPGQGFHEWHYESGSRNHCNRLLVFTLYLNGIEQGGETEFLYYHKRVKPEAGTVCIFPAGFTHLHRGNPPLDATKYIVTGWFEF